MEIKNQILEDVKKLYNPSIINFLKQNLLTILILGLLVFLSFRSFNKNSIPPTDHRIDSLNAIIVKNNEIIMSKEKMIDSLYNTRIKTNNYYETVIKDFSNGTVVSNDSITSYISKKIHNQ